MMGFRLSWDRASSLWFWLRTLTKVQFRVAVVLALCVFHISTVHTLWLRNTLQVWTYRTAKSAALCGLDSSEYQEVWFS